VLADLVRTTKAARAAETPVSTFSDAVARGELPYLIVAGAKHFLISDVVAWVERRRQDGRIDAPAAGSPRKDGVPA
jgi:hypothetical protein